jgi:sulfite exporter TauE/SafE
MSPDGFGTSIILAAAGVGVAHTVLGPDHYLPFIMLSRARGWSRSRTLLVTTLCGLGHVGSSVILGGAGVVFGVALTRLESLEAFRGSLAAWMLVVFGLAYAGWGRGLEPHRHGGLVHIHRLGSRRHDHEARPGGSDATFWALFAVFVLGPCEPLFPLFILPASRGDWGLAALAAATFGAVTLVSMVGLTLLGLSGFERLPLGRAERWSHALAGGMVAGSGLAVLFLGL